MGVTWLVCANKSRARVFEVQRGSDTPKEVFDFINPAGRAHERDLRTDGAGRVYGKGERNQGHTTAAEAGPSAHEAERFAEQVGEFLQQGRDRQRYRQLWIIAAPAFLGVLRDKLTKGVRALAEFELDKDMSAESPREIFRHARDAREARARDQARAHR